MDNLQTAKLIELREDMEYYLKERQVSSYQTFGYYFRRYITIMGKNTKEFAEDIDANPTLLNNIIHNRAEPNRDLLLRLEQHSQKAIPAILWFKVQNKKSLNKSA